MPNRSTQILYVCRDKWKFGSKTDNTANNPQ